VSKSHFGKGVCKMTCNQETKSISMVKLEMSRSKRHNFNLRILSF